MSSLKAMLECDDSVHSLRVIMWTTSLLGPAVSKPCGDDWTPLMLAVKYRRVQCARELLAMGADPNVGAGGTSPLILAAFYLNLDLVRALMKAGADPTARNK